MTDRELILAYVQGRNVRAFDVFVDRHQNTLLSFAATILRDDAGAQDVVQETFLRAARYPKRLLKSGEAGTPARNWLLKVVRDLSIDNLRRRGTERKALDRIAETKDPTSPPADAEAERRERSTEVLAAIDRLKPRLRELVILKVREQKSYKEIAQITGLTVTNVGFLLYQAMKALSRELRNEGSR